MNVLNPHGLTVRGRWKLPGEFVDPSWTTLSSASSQQILESRGLLGMRAQVSAGARAYRRLPWRRYAGQVDLY